MRNRESPTPLADGGDAGASVIPYNSPVARQVNPVNVSIVVWPATVLSEFAVRRLRAHNHPHRVEHLVYEGAGHVIGPPVPGLNFNVTHAVHPIMGVNFEFGGTPEKNTAASLDSWPRIVTFLEKAFS